MTISQKLLCGLVLTGVFLSIQAGANSDGLPFHPGEKLTYRISWSSVLDAGTAQLTVTPSPKITNALKLELKASTAPAFSSTYSFTDEFVSHFEAGLGAPRLFEKSFVERKRVVREKVAFNQLHRSATYTNSKNESKQVPIELGTQDPVSALYALRILGLRPGLQIVFPVLDNGRLYSIEAKVTGTELITTKLGSFETNRVEISILGSAPKLGEKKVTLWFSTDARRIPVLASVAFPVGAGVIELMAKTP
jgi:hypothetical protein